MPVEGKIERKKYQLEIDGFWVESDTISPEDFKKAYIETKEKLGGIYWQPEKLSVEYGNVAKSHFEGAEFMQLDGSKASWTSSGSMLASVSTCCLVSFPCSAAARIALTSLSFVASTPRKYSARGAGASLNSRKL